jgi:hypothetical protein
MKKQVIKDERTLMQGHKILSEACIILISILMISIFVQQFILKANFEQYVVEIICFLGILFYIIIRNLMCGITVSDEGKGMVGIRSIIIGTTVTVVNGILNYSQYKAHYEGNIRFFIATLLVTFASATIGAFIVLGLFKFFNNKRQEQIQKELDKEE